jgi:hypothetical protein
MLTCNSKIAELSHTSHFSTRKSTQVKDGIDSDLDSDLHASDLHMTCFDERRTLLTCDLTRDLHVTDLWHRELLFCLNLALNFKFPCLELSK